MRIPLLSLAVTLVLTVPLVSACSSAVPAPPLTETEQVGFCTHVEQAKGHLAVSLAAYRAGDMAHAKLHAGHPLNENFEVLEPPLKARDPARAASLRQALQAPLDALEGRPGAAPFESAIGAAGERLDEAVRALVPAGVLDSAAFRATVLLELLAAVGEEYGEAVEGERVGSAEEYQDAYGFYLRARSLYQEMASAVQGRAPAAVQQIEKEFASLDGALPGFAAPVRPVPVKQVQGWLEGLSRELADATGVQVRRIDPRTEVAAIRQFLTRMLRVYEQGDAQQATQLAVEMYLDHYEKIEYLIIERAPKLNGQLEPLLASKIRARIKAGAPATELAALVKEAQTGLDEAEKVLAPR